MYESKTILDQLDDQIHPTHTALVIIDMQNDFVDPAGWVAREAMPGYLDSAGIPKALEASRRLLAAARKADLLRVFVRMIGDEKYLSPPMLAQYRRLQGDGRPGCTLEGTWGAEIHQTLAPRAADPREIGVDKYRYSAFAGTRLDLLLRSHGIKTLVACGVATSGCVESTVRDALFADYYVVTASDGCADYQPDRHEHTLRKLDLSFGYVVDADRVTKVWMR